MEQEKVHVRLLILAGVALFWMTAVFGRVAYLQLFRHGDYLAKATRQQRRTIEITPKRGAIYDRKFAQGWNREQRSSGSNASSCRRNRRRCSR
jgi:cell division protein FtsI/penicillin-binding protein 2